MKKQNTIPDAVQREASLLIADNIPPSLENAIGGGWEAFQNSSQFNKTVSEARDTFRVFHSEVSNLFPKDQIILLKSLTAGKRPHREPLEFFWEK